MILPGKGIYIVDGMYIVEAQPIRCKHCGQRCEHERAVMDYLEKGGEPARDSQPESPIANRSAEEAIVAGLILAPGKLGEVKELVTPDDFWYHRCGEAYRGILKAERVGIDFITVSELCDVPQSYLIKMVDSLPSPANLRAYALIVKSTSIRRKVVSLASRLAYASFDDSISLNDIREHVIPRVITSLKKL